MLKEEKIIVKITRKQKEYLDSIGINSKIGEQKEIFTYQLSPGSPKEVTVICDICHKEIKKQYRQYLDITKKRNGKYYCLNCINHTKELMDERNAKSKQTSLERYGIECAGQNKKAKEKRKKTNLEKYGVECASQSEEVKEKIKKTNLEKYGVPYNVQRPEILKKSQEVLKEKYGEKGIQSEEIQKKAIESTIKKYGVSYSFQNKEIWEKAREKLVYSGKVQVSSQQKKIYGMLKEKYGDNCYLNYPCSNLALDCYLEIENNKIDIEYDGFYWHQDQQKDIKRDRVVQKMGIKVLRIKADHKIPALEQILEKIDFLLKDDNYYTEIIMDDIKNKK